MKDFRQSLKTSLILISKKKQMIKPNVIQHLTPHINNLKAKVECKHFLSQLHMSSSWMPIKKQAQFRL